MCIRDRPCITRNDDYKLYYQNFDVIYDIYKQKKEQRSYTRRIVKGDQDDQGNIQNPLFKVHFSINELMPYEV